MILSLLPSVRAVALSVGGLCLGATTWAAAAELPETTLKVVVPWSTLKAYSEIEAPFWQQSVPERSEGKVKADLVSYSELGLKGFELMRLIKLGVFDIGEIVIGYSVSDDPSIEALDLATLTQTMEENRAAAEAYKPVLSERLHEAHGLKFLGLYPNPGQVLWCREKISGLQDLKAKKVRVYGTSMDEFISAVGAAGVTIPLAEVIPALEKGVVDCGITGSLTGYSFKWPEVTKSLYTMRFGWGMTAIVANERSWNSMPASLQSFIETSVADLEQQLWSYAERQDNEGISCSTGDACPHGEPANLVRVDPSADDLALMEKVREEVILKNWASRCGANCARRFNETVGQALGIDAVIE